MFHSILRRGATERGETGPPSSKLSQRRKCHLTAPITLERRPWCCPKSMPQERTLLRFSLGGAGQPRLVVYDSIGRLDSGAKFVVGLLSGYSGLAEAPKRAPPPE